MDQPNDTTGFGAPPPVPGGYGGGAGPVARPDPAAGIGPPPGSIPIPGLAVTSLVCGLAGMPLAFCCCTVIAIPLAVVALVTGIMALQRSAADPSGNHGRGMALGGMVCAALSIAVTILICSIGHVGPNLLELLQGRF